MDASHSTRWPVILPLTLLLGLHAYLGRYAHPMADDFSYALKDISLGAWKAALWEYQHWNGRYASNFLVLFGPLRSGFDGLPLYRMIPGLLLALTLAGAYTFIRTIGRTLPRTDALMLALVQIALFTHLMPDLPEGFYWYTGSVSYQLPNALSLFAAALIVRGSRDGKRWAYLAAAPLLFLITGCCEVSMVLAVIAVLLLYSATAMRGQGPSNGLPWLLLAVLLGALLMILAPGNEGRGALFPVRHQFFHSLGMSALQSVRFSITWAACPALLLASALWLLHRQRLAAHIPGLADGFGLRPWMTIAALAGVTFLCAFPAYWSTGILGQHRTINTACFVFIPLWFLNLSVLAARIPRARLSVHPRDLPRITIAFAVLALIDLGLSGNGGKAMRDMFSGRAERSDAQLWQRYDLLRAAAATPEGIAEIPLIKDPPSSIYVLDLRGPDFLVNRDYAAWFGLKEVRISGSASTDGKRPN